MKVIDKINFSLLKNHWPNLVIIFFFLLSFVGFLTFEHVLSFKIVIILLVFLAVWRLFKNQKSDWLVLIILFLSFFDLYSLYLGVSWSLGLMMLAALLIVAALYYFTLKEKNIVSYVYLTLISILQLEIFLTLIPWPIGPKGKSLILVACFYFFAEMVKLKKEDKLSWQKVLSLTALIIIIFALVILTSQWYR